MKKSIGLALFAASAGGALAAPVYHPSGPNLTYGEISNGQTIISNVTNPAAGAVALQKGGNQYRFGILSSVGAGMEVGEIDNFIDDLDTLSQQFESTYTPLQAAALKADMEALLARMAEDGTLKMSVSAHVPLMPLVITHEALGGSLALDANFGAFGHLSVFDAPVDYNIGTSEIESDSALMVRGAEVAEVSLGYSRSLVKSATGELFGGLRGKYYRIGLAQSLTRVSATGGDSEDVLDDQMDQNLEETSDFGVDLGFLWVSDHYRLGATFANLNEPSFDYRAPDTTGYTDPGVLGDVAALDNQYVMEMQTRLEAAVYSANRNWVLGLGYDANPVEDPAGEEYQWASVSAAYATDSWWIPGLRVGYRANMAGSELTYATLGLTLFKLLNLDVAYGLEKVEVDQEDYPRSLLVNLGLELSF